MKHFYHYYLLLMHSEIFYSIPKKKKIAVKTY